MQARWIKRTKRRRKRYILMGLVYFVVALGLARGQSPWDNDQPIWEYEDDTPTIAIQVRLDLHDITIAWQNAEDYHNKRFVPEYLRREGENAAFAAQWNTRFAPYWTAFNDYLYRYVASKLQVESRTTVPGKTIDFEHSRLRGRMVMVTKALVEKARDLTYYLEDDIVIEKWEIFIRRLEKLEDTIKELDD